MIRLLAGRLGILRFIPPDCVADQLTSAGQIELSSHIRPVDLDGFDAQVQMFGNIPRWLALAQHLKHLEFAIGQALDWGLGIGPMAGKVFKNPRGDFFTDINAPAQHLTDGLHEALAAFLFHDVTAASGSQDPFGVEGLVMHGDHQNGEAGMQRVNVLYELEPAFVGQRNIHYQQVRQGAFNASQGFGGRIGLSFDGKIGFMVDELRQAFAHHWVIVHNENAFLWLNRFFHRLG
jgi:hypothetical protein